MKVPVCSRNWMTRETSELHLLEQAAEQRVIGFHGGTV